MLSQKQSLRYFLNYENTEILNLAQKIIHNQNKIHSLKVISAKQIFDAMYRLGDITRRIELDTNEWWQNLCIDNRIDGSNLPLNRYCITPDAYRSPKDINYFQTIPTFTLPEIADHFPELIKSKQFNPIEAKIKIALAQIRLQIGEKGLYKELGAILKRLDNANVAEITEFRKTAS